jgi:hypothetical protein
LLISFTSYLSLEITISPGTKSSLLHNLNHTKLCMLRTFWFVEFSFWISNTACHKLYLRAPFAKFVESPYYSESKLSGSAVTVSFSNHLPWQAMHFLQRSTHFSKTCCRPLLTSKFLDSEFPFHVWKSPEIARGENWVEFCVRLGKSGSLEPH